jgi:hypothetical protein
MEDGAIVNNIQYEVTVQIIMCFGISLLDFVQSIVPDESTDG